MFVFACVCVSVRAQAAKREHRGKRNDESSGVQQNNQTSILLLFQHRIGDASPESELSSV